MRMIRVGIVVLGVIGLRASYVLADPAYFAGTGHYYQIVETPLNWADAKAAAEASSWLGVPGYLATIHSQAENDFIASLPAQFLYDNNYWLGLWQNPDSPSYGEPNGGWEWVTGEPVTYLNWTPSSPDNVWDDDRTWMIIFPGASTHGQWEDEPHTTAIGYVVEYVPEPSTLSILALGGLALARRRRG